MWLITHAHADLVLRRKHLASQLVFTCVRQGCWSTIEHHDEHWNPQVQCSETSEHMRFRYRRFFLALLLQLPLPPLLLIWQNRCCFALQVTQSLCWPTCHRCQTAIASHTCCALSLSRLRHAIVNHTTQQFIYVQVDAQSTVNGGTVFVCLLISCQSQQVMKTLFADICSSHRSS